MTESAATTMSIIRPSEDAVPLPPRLSPTNPNRGPAAPGECKILRLKRKRNEEPLDGLRTYLSTRRSEFQTRLTRCIWTVVEQALVTGQSPTKEDHPHP